MSKPNLLKALLVLSVLSVLSTGCSEAIWIAKRFFGSERFNLQTGVTTKISEGLAFPSRDGSAFVEYFKDHETAPSKYCDISWDDIHRFNVKNTRTGAVMGTFGLNRGVGRTIRLSPDGERIAMYVAADAKDCGSNIFDYRFSVFSKRWFRQVRGANGNQAWVL